MQWEAAVGERAVTMAAAFRTTKFCFDNEGLPLLIRTVPGCTERGQARTHTFGQSLDISLPRLRSTHTYTHIFPMVVDGVAVGVTKHTLGHRHTRQSSASSTVALARSLLVRSPRDSQVSKGDPKSLSLSVTAGPPLSLRAPVSRL